MGRRRVLVPIRFPVGGIRTYLKYTYGCMCRDSYELTLMAPSKVWLDRIKVDLSGYRVNTVTIQEKRAELGMFWQLMGHLGSGKYDVVHSQGYTAGIITVLANLFSRVPHLITLHSTFDETERSLGWDGVLKNTRRRVLELVLGRAEVVQVVGVDAYENLLSYLPGLWRKPGRVRMNNSGVKIDAPEMPIPGEDEWFEKEEGVFTVGFLGRYMPEKGFPELIDTMESIVKERQNEGIKLVCVGGLGAYLREYQREIRGRGLEHHFEFVEFVHNVMPLLKALDAVVIPSHREALGLLAIECLVCGTPVIAFGCIGVREVLKGTPGRVVDVGDVGGLAREITAVMENYPIVKSEFDEYVETAKKRFDSRNTARWLDEIFEELIKEDVRH